MYLILLSTLLVLLSTYDRKMSFFRVIGVSRVLSSFLSFEHLSFQLFKPAFFRLQNLSALFVCVLGACMSRDIKYNSRQLGQRAAG